jgi:hypothetical protein
MCSFNIIPKSAEDIDKSGVYKIWFGEKFYIGSTKNSTSRMKSHSNTISSALTNPFFIEETSVKNIVDHIRANPGMTEAVLEMIHLCEGIQNLVDQEYISLMTYKGRINCLNLSFQSTRNHKGVTYYPSCFHGTKYLSSHIVPSANACQE